MTSFGFTGEYGDSNGLLYLRARYYAPSQGRFFQLDPSRLEMNPYLYAGSNPILHTDPTGLSHCEPGTTNCHRTGAVAHDSSTSNVVGFNLSLPYELLQNTCKLPPGLGDYFRGVVQQVLWDLTWPMHTQVSQRVDTNALIVYVTINGLAPGTLPDFSGLYSDHWLGSPSKFDGMYREGSPDYRAGRDVGRTVTYLIGVYEISQGVTIGLSAGSAIGPTGGATATSCALAETGVGAIGCLLGGVALTVEVGAVAGSAVAVAHGAGMIVYAATHPPGSSGSGSGDLGGRSTSGPLQASDLDIKGEIASFDATYEFTDDTMTIRVRMIEGEIENPFEVVQNAMEFARSKGASVLRLEASIVNEQLYRIAQRRYGLVTQGGTDFIVIPLD